MHLHGAHYFLFLRVCSGIPLGRSTNNDRTPPSLPASIKEILKEEHSGKAHEEVEALSKDHNPVEKIYKACYSSTTKHSGATVEDTDPGYPLGNPVGRADYAWRGTSGLLASQV